MIIILKQSIKTIFILLLLISGGTLLNAGNSTYPYTLAEFGQNELITVMLYDYKATDHKYYLQEDTVLTGKNDTVKSIEIQNDRFNFPDRLAKMQINFQINSFISYLNINHFVRNESKKIYFQAWLKENELQRLSIQTDSLRNVYANTDLIKKEEISRQILNAEKKSIALNEEIPAMYEMARVDEDLYWQEASLDVIAKFQEKIRIYKDSIRQNTILQNGPTNSIYPAIQDTIILYKSPAKTDEKKAELTIGAIYKIQIGAYKGKIPDSANKLIKKLSVIRKVEKHIDDKGVTIYTTGNLKYYKDAVTMQNQVKQEGIKNAVINAYQNGKKITVNEARKLNNEL